METEVTRLAGFTPHEGPAHVIVLGNEKGGSGKSTTAMHLAVHLVRQGYRVGCLDLDARQGTLRRYIKNRLDYSKQMNYRWQAQFTRLSNGSNWKIARNQRLVKQLCWTPSLRSSNRAVIF